MEEPRKPPIPPGEFVKKSPKLLSLADLNLPERVPTKEELFNKEVERLVVESSDMGNTGQLFSIKKGSEWVRQAARTAAPAMLFDEMWHEGELCILFADTNVGKSILAVQIGDSISRGVPIDGLQMTAAAQRVTYFDFELSEKQFEARYSRDPSHIYPFADYFLRAVINVDDDYIERGFKTFEAYLADQLEHYVEMTGIKVLIIDNLTYLNSQNETAKDAYHLMSMLNKLKRKHSLSLLVLAHTPKRDQSLPIEKKHLQGSSQISNFTDSMIAIGQSAQDNYLRYIKQLKLRTGAKRYEADNVIVCQVTKPDDFLHFEMLGYATEREHLREVSDKELGSRIAAIKDLAAQGKTQREIAAQIGISVATVCRYLKK